jgi:hypothetical protein
VDLVVRRAAALGVAVLAAAMVRLAGSRLARRRAAN